MHVKFEVPASTVFAFKFDIRIAQTDRPQIYIYKYLDTGLLFPSVSDI